jgi:hypothetical protein
MIISHLFNHVQVGENELSLQAMTSVGRMNRSRLEVSDAANVLFLQIDVLAQVLRGVAGNANDAEGDQLLSGENAQSGSIDGKDLPEVFLIMQNEDLFAGKNGRDQVLQLQYLRQEAAIQKFHFKYSSHFSH